jgi:hypothetical protein
MPNPIEPAPAVPLRNRRGNPLGNPGLALSPRCGARTRRGCPCRGPAIHGGLRCRMHGGRSTGPRTETGLARSRTARLTHGGYSEETRAETRYQIMLVRRTGVFLEVVRCLDRLPAELASRALEAPELAMPPRPTRGLSEPEDRVVRRQEAAALLPWRQAVKAARGKWDEAHAPVFEVGEHAAAAGGASLTRPTKVTAVRDGWGQLGAHAGDEPHAPVADAAHPCSSVFICGSTLPGSRPDAARPRDDVALRGSAGVVELTVDGPHAPVFQQHAVARAVDEPHAPVLGPPAGLTRKERKRWKWEQHKARKVGAPGVDGPCS